MLEEFRHIELQEVRMSSKKYNKGNSKKKPEEETYRSHHSPFKVWLVRIVIVLLCIAVAVTLIPSVFF